MSFNGVICKTSLKSRAESSTRRSSAMCASITGFSLASACRARENRMRQRKLEAVENCESTFRDATCAQACPGASPSHAPSCPPPSRNRLTPSSPPCAISGNHATELSADIHAKACCLRAAGRSAWHGHPAARSQSSRAYRRRPGKMRRHRHGPGVRLS